MKKEIKRISLMTAIFLTVALASSVVEAGVIRINGTVAGSEIDTPFPDPAEGFYVNGSVNRHAAWSIHTVFFGPSGLCFLQYATWQHRGNSFDSGRRR